MGHFLRELLYLENNSCLSLFQDEGLINEIWRAVRNGHRKLAGYYVTKAVEKDGFGFNFLHKEVI